jgi:hypothetical protein
MYLVSLLKGRVVLFQMGLVDEGMVLLLKSRVVLLQMSLMHKRVLLKKKR